MTHFARGLLSIGLVLPFFLVTSSADAQIVGNGDGKITVRSFHTAGGGGSNDNDLNSSTETGGIWNFLDANPGFTTGLTPSISGKLYNVAGNNTSLQSFVNHDGGNFGGDSAYPNGNFGGDDFSYRAQTFIEFSTAGTYVVGAGSDDGRRVQLTEALPGSAPGFAGFNSQAGQVDGGFVAGQDFVIKDGTTGHNNSRGEFDVNAGDILALDAFFFERGGGDSFEVFIGQGGIGTPYAGGFSILQDGLFNGGISLHSSVEDITAVPEPASIAIWSLLGLTLAGYGYRRRRRNS